MIAAESDSIRDQLLKLAHDLPFLANAKSKPESVVLTEAKARLRAIEESVGQGEQSTFTRITAEGLALGKFRPDVSDRRRSGKRPAGRPCGPEEVAQDEHQRRSGDRIGHGGTVPRLLSGGRAEADGRVLR